MKRGLDEQFFGPVPAKDSGKSAQCLAASLTEIADVIARAQHGEWVSIDSLGVATVPSEGLRAMGSSSDDEVEDGMIELDR